MDAESLYQIGFFVSTVMFILSEYIGYSSCDSKGVLEFCVRGYCITISKSNHEINTPHEYEALTAEASEDCNITPI